MKSKLTKVLLFALIGVLLFGTIAPSAYESYDTYTYSIDGEPLASPHAYTPDVETYDSHTMGLLAGYYWVYVDGQVAIWNGDGMEATPTDIDFTSEGLVFELNADGESYSVIGYENASEDAVKAIAIPATYEDLPVTGIADGAFEITEDEIADEAERAAAIAKLYAIESVVLGENITSIGKRAFAGTSVRNFYTELYEKDFSFDAIADDNRTITEAKLYYYSDITKFGNTELSKTRDLATDNQGNLYIADTGNNRIVILNGRDYKTIGIIKTYTDEYGRTQSFNNPSGIFVTDPDKVINEKHNGIYVCDTANKRIVVFNSDFTYKRTIEEPNNALLDENDFTPTAMAVDIYGRIFAISNNCSNGVMVMSNEGVFTGFIGAQKVTKSLIDQIWESFKSADELDSESKNLSVPFNNITVDDDGFVYVTISFTEQDDLSQQLKSITSKEAAYSPVKKLNSMGVEIMKRNGFFDPGGEVLTAASGAMATDVSKITDIAMGPEGSWTILDANRSRLYTYDQNGNLLFAFGDKGAQVGNGKSYVAMAYQKVVDGDEESYNLVLLDDTGETGYKIIVYHPTEYCNMILQALRNQNNHNYAETITNWQSVLTSNNNFDLAYIGIGKALFNQGKYEEALEMLSSAYETEYYSKAFTEIRKNLIADYMLLLFAGAIVLLVLLIKFLGWAKKKNKATSLKVGKRTYLEELLYVFHLVFHPFDGFWDLKHEKRGSVRAGATILAVTIAAFFYQAIGKGYMFNPRDTYSTVFIQVIAVIVPVLLWVVGNWCLTTLFDGEGSMKDIFIATTYALAPLPLFVTVSTILTNVLTVSEGSIVNLLVTFGYVWVAILLFFGMVVTHDYTTGKNVIATLGSIVAMAVIMFIAILFSSLVMKMVTFIIAIFTEIFSRLA